MANTPAILAEGLYKSYGKTHALDGVDLVAEEGRVLGVLGPKGAGKTTAVRILTTLTRPDRGRAEVAGQDVVKHAQIVRGRIGLTGQYAAVDELLTGYENLKMFGQLSRLSGAVAKRRAQELLARFDLVQAASRLVKTYSGGMRRRLDLAASLILSPPILFLDEPTTGLDPRGRLAMWGLIRDLVAQGTTALLTAFVFSWLAVLLGLVVSSPEAVQGASLVIFYPLIFGSNAFVPISTMPDWLRAFADHQPISAVIGAVRGLLLNQPDAAAIGQALAWCVGLLVVFIGLSVLAYGRRTAR